ncbi:Oxygen-independent coproporphyrinogen-III oxidase 1 [Photobacterium damselae subsp. piscicida]|uniref:Heme chaperone HemW n=1 Tax=Photobacterium damsela subsp. piscicida TaxID=38294 RepID=A0A1V1V5W2_PHODP|nr:radical SAM family heme chaperone HemW [Photobacterium damselae]MBE8128366.1 radical SAM family heme chaperone HemW [Photobacterium damselae subsp. piscicida]PSV75111.1 YggW family oxidoreductase [Photobacterium damselae]PSW78044.1 YggW family oxidoreductase [Photobacterium damselae]QOD53075.1 radical SAM family heme chaperone HemW [Photobacterium damselae subsp. piscicida]QOD56916.1 radical SAM family heme chaperone HemW [Photobacterium damselae subsp. piscicida]
MLIPPPLSLYVHIPWCVQKCPYCDFNSHALKAEIPELDYIDALLDDLSTDLLAYHLDHGERKLHSIFIGGGTPSLISPEEIARLLQGIEARIPFSDDIEITMEANPGTVEAGRFQAYQQAGVNRISIGIQSFQDEKLKRLGRIHGAQEAITAAKLAAEAGLNSFNIDLMHGLPDQSINDALADLAQAIGLNPPHLSWYQLTIEPNTLFYSQPPTLPDDDDLWDIFEQGHKMLTDAGYVQYEISGYSKPGKQCQHNLNYWRFGDYLGIGCGSHGKISFDDGRIVRTVKVKHPRGYLNPEKAYLDQETVVANDERPFEFFMNRFRLLEACPKQDFVARTGLPLTHIQGAIDWALAQNYLTESDTHWQITEHGKLFLNDLLAAFVEDDE